MVLGTRTVADIVQLAHDDKELWQGRTDSYLSGMAKDNPLLLAEVLFELACTDDRRLNEISADNIGTLYSANPDIGRPLWELMVETEGTSSDARCLLDEYSWEVDVLTPRQIEDFAAIQRRHDEYTTSQRANRIAKSTEEPLGR